DDPLDGGSLVAALKSFLFGVSDPELLDAAERGARFDAPASLLPVEPLRPALELLEALRRLRHERPFSETVLALLSARHATLAAEADAVPHGRQAAANLARLLLHAR